MFYYKHNPIMTDGLVCNYLGVCNVVVLYVMLLSQFTKADAKLYKDAKLHHVQTMNGIV